MKMPAGEYEIQYAENSGTDITDIKYLIFHYFDNTQTTVKVEATEEIGYYAKNKKNKDICYRDENMKIPWFQIIKRIRKKNTSED